MMGSLAKLLSFGNFKGILTEYSLCVYFSYVYSPYLKLPRPPHTL